MTKQNQLPGFHVETGMLIFSPLARSLNDLPPLSISQVASNSSYQLDGLQAAETNALQNLGVLARDWERLLCMDLSPPGKPSDHLTPLPFSPSPPLPLLPLPIPVTHTILNTPPPPPDFH